MPRPGVLSVTVDDGDSQQGDADGPRRLGVGDAGGGKVGVFSVTPFASTEEFVAQGPAAESVLREGTMHKRIVSKRIYWAERIVTLTSDRIFLAKANSSSGELECRDELRVLDISRVQQVAHSSNGLNSSTMRDMGRESVDRQHVGRDKTFEFVVTSADGKMVVCSVDTAEERDTWVGKLSQASVERESRTEHEGFVRKRGRPAVAYTKQYFVLAAGQLRFYKTKPSRRGLPSEQGSMACAGLVAVRQGDTCSVYCRDCVV